ncbi:hypothetical protein [Nocardia sp. NBC_01009]|uniref:hypothetical protein n=1 Tax=Nocardia sp. NBC_01009 TaxID=2975996 RepID=UPI00386D0A9F|nr:hypothetical protein OHA42_36425 [Nocardia sp. NBC_01009]
MIRRARRDHAGVRTLAQYAMPNPPRLAAAVADGTPPGPEREAFDLAVCLAMACTAKQRGVSAVGVGALRLPPARDLLDEVDQLTAIAAHWPRARVLAHQYNGHPQQTPRPLAGPAETSRVKHRAGRRRPG